VEVLEEVPAWPRGSYDAERYSFGARGAETVGQAAAQAEEFAHDQAARAGRRMTFYVFAFCPCLQERPRGRCKLCQGTCRDYLAGGRVPAGGRAW
jgi:hypothetical protein